MVPAKSDIEGIFASRERNNITFSLAIAQLFHINSFIINKEVYIKENSWAPFQLEVQEYQNGCASLEDQVDPSDLSLLTKVHYKLAVLGSLLLYIKATSGPIPS